MVTTYCCVCAKSSLPTFQDGGNMELGCLVWCDVYTVEQHHNQAHPRCMGIHSTEGTVLLPQ